MISKSTIKLIKSLKRDKKIFNLIVKAFKNIIVKNFVFRVKILRKEYTKWNGQTNHKDVKKKKRAKEMVKIIADLRKQYSS